MAGTMASCEIEVRFRLPWWWRLIAYPAAWLAAIGIPIKPGPVGKFIVRRAAVIVPGKKRP